MKGLRCIGTLFHAWGQWEDGTYTITRPCQEGDGCRVPLPAGEVHTIVRPAQYRRCLACGRLQRLAA